MEGRERRYKVLMVPTDQVLGLLPRQNCEYLAIPEFPDLPEDAIVEQVRHDEWQKRLCFLVWSSEFDVVPDGAAPPDFVSPLDVRLSVVLSPNAIERLKRDNEELRHALWARQCLDAARVRDADSDDGKQAAFEAAKRLVEDAGCIVCGVKLETVAIYEPERDAPFAPDTAETLVSFDEAASVDAEAWKALETWRDRKPLL